jgi:hypothetical protein
MVAKVMTEQERRLVFTNGKTDQLKNLLIEAEKIAGGNACVYATGSFGRVEASNHSDLDLFIVGKSENKPDFEGRPISHRMLSGLSEICLKAELINAAKKLKFPEFSQDGRFLTHCTITDLTKSLGTPEDDAFNTFTARMLLLLESKPIVGGAVYDEVVSKVIEAYWRDFEDHKDAFIPAFLANDVLRFWRTLCVNYEARRYETPDKKKAEGKAKNFKLKHSRMLTCYSGLLFLLGVHKLHGTVTQKHAINMTKLSPTERLSWLRDQKAFVTVSANLKMLLEKYEAFLEVTKVDEDSLIELFLQKEKSRDLLNSSGEFGNSIFKIMTELGKDTDFLRVLVV